MAFEAYHKVNVPFDYSFDFYAMLDWLDETGVEHDWRGMTVFFKHKKDIPMFFLRWGTMSMEYGKEDVNEV